MNDQKENKRSLETGFVEAVIAGCKTDKGFAAKLRRADNPATEYQSWEILGRFGIDIEKDYLRLPFLTVGSSIAKEKPERNGKVRLGKAIANAFEGGNTSDQARTRLRRLLSCDEAAEVCRILRPLLALIQSRASKGEGVDHIRLLEQLRSFHFKSKQIKAQWAQEFYSQTLRKAEEAEQ